MKCFYHNDSDGKCAGFWVHLNAAITDSKLGYPIDFIEIDYRMKFPIDTIKPNEQIYIVDFSISPDEMRELLKITKDVTWIDHHKTAIEKYSDFEYEIRGIRYDGIAGCMLTYCYLNRMTNRGLGVIADFYKSMTDDAPMFTKLIADWDVWKFDFGDDTRFFQTAFNAYDFNPRSPKWFEFLDIVGYATLNDFYDILGIPRTKAGEYLGMCNDVLKAEYLFNKQLSSDGDFNRKFIDQGVIMTQYRDNWAKNYMSIGFETIFEGHKCFAVNLGMCNSEYFKSLPSDTYDILMPFSFDGELFKVSMYSTKVDVSNIALKYGGGGHKGASGFQVKELPFSKIKI